MKEILKYYEPPFKAQYVFPTGLAYVVDASGNSLAKVWDDNSTAQEIAAALNNAVTWNVESTPSGDNWFEGGWKDQQKETMSQEEFKRLYECNFEGEEPNKAAEVEGE